MNNRINQAIINRFKVMPDKITSLGGGFYGRVFLAEFDKSPFKVVIKLYLFSNIAKKEALQIKTLSEHALFKMPEIYFVDIGENGENDILVMEYIEGKNAGLVENIPAESKAVLANEMVDNLIAYHSFINKEGFGQLEADKFVSDWRDYYRPIAENIFKKAERLFKQSKLDGEILEIMKRALSLFDKVFYLPITEARLIHGDYNTWNIMLTNDLEHVKAIIDPFNCCFADSEFDLYQLDNANGKEYGLLELYKAKRGLSDNFKLKRAFYELFTEVNHYYDADVEINKPFLLAQAKALDDVLKLV